MWRSEDNSQELVLSFHCEPWPSAQLVRIDYPPSHFSSPLLNWKIFFFLKSGDYLLIIFCVLKHCVKYVGDTDARVGPCRTCYLLPL